MNYQCPVCHEALHASAEQALSCSAGHSFDVAKQGYVNLLLAHQSRSRVQGDAPSMLASRSRFFSTKAYYFLAAAVSEQIARHHTAGANLLDVGCGEGYYLEHYLKDVPDLNPGYALGPGYLESRRQISGAAQDRRAPVCRGQSRTAIFSKKCSSGGVNFRAL